MRSEHHVVVIGAGVGGMAAALELAAAGVRVTVVERGATPGGKLRGTDIGNSIVDAGPTVFTMRWVFDELFAAAQLRFSDFVDLQTPSVLARHAWVDGSQLDLFTSVEQSAASIGKFAGAAESERYLAFASRARSIYRTLEGPFIRRSCASPLALMRAVGFAKLADLWRITPFTSLWRSLNRQFTDPRLRQLFGRYATYCGSSPFAAPATLMLVAHVEQEGVWLLSGGMHRLATAMADAARSRGADIRFLSEASEIATKSGRVSGVRLTNGELIQADSVVVNADCAAVADGLFGSSAAQGAQSKRGATRSLSAITWACLAQCRGFELDHHNVFFSSDYRSEFTDIFERSRVPREPTVYVCAQDRGGTIAHPSNRTERLLCLINAPANGDTHKYDESEIAQCTTRTLSVLQRCGIQMTTSAEFTRTTTPEDFNRLYPATGGALYGAASHGYMASFNRPGSRTRLPGLYLAGGSAHPGPGVPMAALSGRLAAASVMADLDSTARSSVAVTSGGMSMP